MLDFLLASREPGKLLHAFSNFLPRQTQLLELLEVQPKLRADAKPVAKTQRGVILRWPLMIAVTRLTGTVHFSWTNHTLSDLV